MSKRFVDTDKFKKPFIKTLPAAYKILWEYICLDCDHAGIWQVDFEIAQIRIGKDAPVTEAEAFAYFNAGEERVISIDGGKKWYIKPFVEFQYGELDPRNRVHASVATLLEREGIKPLIRALQGCKDKDKEKDKDKDKEKDPCPLQNSAGKCHRIEKDCPFRKEAVKRVNGICYVNHDMGARI